MLEPDIRELLLDLLRPPDGWQLGHAVGTTFTLDLQALLVAPLAFAMFDWALDEDGRADPIAVLEALRRNAERTTLFCQAGMIGLPADYQPLLIHLEPCVVTVTPPAGGIFHPKVWLLQFVQHDEPARYRLVTLSRNLTFDTSWDTVVALEGTRRLKTPHGAPIGGFLRGLVDLGGSRVDQTRRQALQAIADDVTKVTFDRPDGYDGTRFHPIGFDGAAWPFPGRADRTLVVSPFLGGGTATRLGQMGDHNVLVSRPESLDEIGADRLDGFGRVAVLSTEADTEALDQPAGPGLDGGVDDDGPPSVAEGHLRGLHAKVFAFETGGRLRLFTGSANATDAAFSQNIEFLVELTTSTDRVNIGAFLEGPEGVTSFGDLLADYTPGAEPGEVEPSRELSTLLERTQRTIGMLPLQANVAPVDGSDDMFSVELHAPGPIKLPEAVREVHCWRITAGQGHLVTPRIGADGLHAAFGHVHYDGLTSFFAFELVANLHGRTDRVRFVVNAELIGAPTDRAETVIARLLKNRDDLVRYLLFLLTDASTDMIDLIKALQDTGGQTAHGDPRPLFGQPALMESLLRALVHNPGQIDHVRRLLDDLAKAGTRDRLVPDGLMDLWAAIEPVHHEITGPGGRP